MKVTRTRKSTNVVENVITNLELITLLGRKIELNVQNATLARKHRTRIISLIVTNGKSGVIRKFDLSASTVNP